MGSNRLSRTRIFNDKDFTIKSSSSNSMIESSTNRGSYVENSQVTCGKVSEKSGKVGGKSGKGLTAWQAESQASALIAIFEAPQCRNFFLKCVYHLTDKEIQEAINYATRPNIVSPVRYFNKVCKSKLEQRGY